MNKQIAKIVLTLAIVATAGAVGAQNTVQLPDMGGTSTRLMSPEDEKNFPRDFERFLRSNQLLLEDPMIRDYFEDMGYRLVSYSARKSSDFHFFVLDDPSINAFAAPAGVIGLNAGLILAARHESEVAGVVAHEIAHVTQDHLARGLENAQQVSIPTLLATLGLALAAGAAGASGEASQAILMSGVSLAQQFQINHTRQSEAEADRIGIGLLASAGYDPNGMAGMFQRMNLLARPMGEGPPEYLRTHPLTVNRIAEARDRAQGVTVRDQRDGDEFHFVQARLRARVSEYPGTAEEYFRARLSGDDQPAQAMRYGLALTLIRDRRLDEAADQVEKLLELDPGRRIYLLLEADLKLARGHLDESLDILASLYRQYSGNRLVTTQYAQTLMHNRDSEKAARAAEVLRQYLRNHPNDVRMTELYARAADRAGETVRAAEALAESYYMRGSVNEAIQQLERISQRNDIDYYQRARVSARLNELRAERLRLTSQERNQQ